MRSIFKSSVFSSTFLAIGGQGAFLLSNLILFLLVVREFSQEEFGVWAMYLTMIAIVDGLRQGFLQNGFTRFRILFPESKGSLFSSALVLHFLFIALASVCFYLSAGLISDFWQMPMLQPLLKLAILPLFSLGTVQGLAVLCFAEAKADKYLILNAVYLICLLIGLFLLNFFWTMNLPAILIVQGIASVPLIFFAKSFKLFHWESPTVLWITKLLSHGKYIAVTNLFSLLFQKMDVLMIGYFLNPAAVAMFHLATKVIQYVELPLSALSQTIYPKLAAAHRSNDVNQLKAQYGQGILLLFVLLAPGALIAFIFGGVLVEWLSSSEYMGAVPLLMILVPATLIKPWGRVFGLALDAVGKPKVNFQMLTISLAVNGLLNLILITSIGLIGAAIATSLSIVITILWGQVRIKKHLSISPGILPFEIVKNQVLTRLKLSS